MRAASRGADVVGADSIESGKIVGAMVCEGDARSIQHLQKEIPYQAVGLFDLVEK